MTMEVKVKAVENGFIVEYPSDVVSNTLTAVVFQSEDEDTDKHKFATMLRYLLDHFGLTGSRYDKERIYVELRPGDKYEEPSSSRAGGKPDNV